MASAAIETDYFELSASAARRLKVSPATLIRFEAIRLQLAAHGVRRNDKRIPLWIAPILCTTPEARRLFLEGFPEDPDDVRRPMMDRARNTASEGKVRPKSKDGRPIGWRETMLGSGLLLLLAAILLMTPIPPEPPVVNEAVEAPITSPSPPNLAPAPPPAAEPNDEVSVITLLMLLLPSLLAVTYIVWLRHRRRSIRRDNAPAPERSVNLAFATGLQNFLTDRTLRKALGNLRRHRPVASSKLNVPAAIRATIRSAGFPQMRYGFRPRSPDYLLLNERESPADHLTMIGRVMATRMTEEHVAHGRYEYFGDPRRLQLIERGAPAGVFPLTTVLARHDGARVMLFQESHDCFAEETSPEWLARIAETERPVLLNPRLREAWGPAESRLTALGLGIVSPSGSGIVDYGDYLNATGNVRRRLAASSASRFDLPESLARDRDLLLDNDPPLDLLITELVTDLDLWLDDGGIHWLRALALFPYIDPGFTVFLGTALRDEAGKPLMDEARFIDLARLPWLRAGRMPDWLRRALVRGLTPAQLEAATNAIQAFLMPAEQPDRATAIDFSRGENRKLRKRLLEWLKLTPESVLSDQLLIEALGGRPPDELGLEAPKTLLRHSRKLWAGNEARAAALAVAATIAIAAWQLPWPQPSEDQANEVSANEIQAAGQDDGVDDGLTNLAEATTRTNQQKAETQTNEAEATTQTTEQLQAAPTLEPFDPSQTSPTVGRPVPSQFEPTVERPTQSRPAPTFERPTPSQPAPTGQAPTPSQQAPTGVIQPGNSGVIQFEPGTPIRTIAGPFIVFFNYDSYELTPEAQAILRSVAQTYIKDAMSRRRGSPGLVQVLVQGYADGGRSPEYSIGLSQRMADAVANYLSSLEIPRSDIVTRAWSSRQPLVATTPGLREPQNRRVEITITEREPAPTAN